MSKAVSASHGHSHLLSLVSGSLSSRVEMIQGESRGFRWTGDERLCTLSLSLSLLSQCLVDTQTHTHEGCSYLDVHENLDIRSI